MVKNATDLFLCTYIPYPFSQMVKMLICDLSQERFNHDDKAVGYVSFTTRFLNKWFQCEAFIRLIFKNHSNVQNL